MVSDRQQRDNNIVIVLGGQQKDSAIHIQVSFLPQVPLSRMLPHSIETVPYPMQSVLVGYPFKIEQGVDAHPKLPNCPFPCPSPCPSFVRSLRISEYL